MAKSDLILFREFKLRDETRPVEADQAVYDHTFIQSYLELLTIIVGEVEQA